MYFQELGSRIRQAREARGMTQQQLAAAAGLSRPTLNQLERGFFADLGVRKVQTVLDQLGLSLSVARTKKARRPDFVRMACTSAGVSFKTPLTEDQLLRALLGGTVPTGRRPHLRVLLDEASPSLLRGLVSDVQRWARPGRVQANVAKIADEVGAERKVHEWLTPA